MKVNETRTEKEKEREVLKTSGLRGEEPIDDAARSWTCLLAAADHRRRTRRTRKDGFRIGLMVFLVLDIRLALDAGEMGFHESDIGTND